MKSDEEIKQEVRDLIAQTLNLSLEAVTETSTLSDLAEDSIQLFELLIAFEKKYEMTATYEEVIDLNTVADVISYVAKVKYNKG